MKKQWIWIAALVALIALLIGAWFLYDSLRDSFLPSGLATQPTQETGETEVSLQMAPDITVYDPQGNAVKLSDLRGKPVVLNVWASWCGPCKQEMPAFQATYEKYDGQLQFMMVNLSGQDKLEDARTLLAETGYTFPVYYDTDNSAAQSYNTGSIPATFFVNKEGQLVTYAIGAINEAVLEQGIGMIMG